MRRCRSPSIWRAAVAATALSSFCMLSTTWPRIAFQTGTTSTSTATRSTTSEMSRSFTLTRMDVNSGKAEAIVALPIP